MSTIVFGATGSLGSHVTRYMLEKGVRVIAVGRDQQKLEKLNEGVGSLEQNLSIFASKYDAEDTNGAFTLASTLGGPVDCVVSCIGTLQFSSIAKSVGPGHPDATAIVAATTAILNGAAKHMQYGSVALITSIAGSIPVRNHVPIAIASGGIEGLARCFSAEMSGKVRVNTLRLGLTRTESTKGIWDNPETMKKVDPQYPFGINEPESIARFIYTLANTKGITNQFITMDGGYSA